MAKKRKTKRKIPRVSPPDFSGKKFKFIKDRPKYLNEKPKFAFNYYVDPDKQWSFKCITDCKQFHAFFRNMKHMSSLTWGEIKQAFQFHAHEVNWNIKALPLVIKKLEKNPEIRDLPLLEFKAFNECRIVGLFNYDCIFEIICVDKKHLMYP